MSAVEEKGPIAFSQVRGFDAELLARRLGSKGSQGLDKQAILRHHHHQDEDVQKVKAVGSQAPLESS